MDKTRSLNRAKRPNELWPELPYESWKDTCGTLHRWTQIIGKIRLSKSKWVNHAWHSTLYVTETGLTTSVIHDGGISFGLELDLVSHVLRMRRSDGKQAELALSAEPLARFHERCIDALGQLGVHVRISGHPNELPDATPFAKDLLPRSYEPEYAKRFHRVLLQCDRLMKEFRANYVGKVSPVHFFWGSFDLAVTRFSGRRAPEHPGGVPHLPDLVTRDAYSHEVSSCGFWPGNEIYQHAAFYSYAYPVPEGFERTPLPGGAYYEPKLREFVLPYDFVRASGDPERLILEFFESCYESAAKLGKWDRPLLEESPYLEKLQGSTARRHLRRAG